MEMNEQEKRENVIRELQEAVDWLSTETSLTIVDQRVVRDALTLLKAQEPRVMTPEEVRALLAMPDILPRSGDNGDETVKCTKVNCPMQAGTKTDNCGENCQWRTTAKTGDLISRTASIEAIKPLLYSGNCVSTLINMPAVDAVPVVHGRWVYEYGDPMLMPCSVCGYQVYRYSNTHYCPNCGAKMDGE